MFENPVYLSEATCSENTITTMVADKFAYLLVTNWPQSGFIIITNSDSCNTKTQRGVYLVNNHTVDSSSSVFTFNVTVADWASVSENMTISYGTTFLNIPKPVTRSIHRHKLEVTSALPS